MSGAASPRWPAGTTPGLARLRANSQAERIRQEVLADQERASADASAAIVANSGAELAAILAAKRHGAYAPDQTPRENSDRVKAAKAPVRRSSSREHLINDSPVIAGQPAPAPAPAALAPEARALLAAVAYAPPLRDLEPEAKIGVWIAYQTIHQSDRPHGLNRRRVPGFMTTLHRRGFVECRAERAGKYSARVTAAGVALLAAPP